MFALIRISTPQQTCLDRFCSSLASPPSPTTSYASCTSSSSVCSIITASALPGPPGVVQTSQESWCGVVLLHGIPLLHHFTAVWSWTWEGFAHAGPPPPTMFSYAANTLTFTFHFVCFLLLQNSSGGMKCVKFGGWKSALWGVEKCQFGGWKCVKFGGWKCAGMK